MTSVTFICAILISITNVNGDFIGGELEDIREKAITFYDTVNISENGQRATYLDLDFTCSGNITSIWFIASSQSPDTSTTVYPEFQLWRPNRFFFTQQFVIALIDSQSPPSNGTGLNVISSNGDISLYNFVLGEPMMFKSGNMLGIQQTAQSRLAVFSLSGSGIRNFWGSVGSNPIYRLNSGQDRVPLVALEVTNSSCLQGFLSVESLQLYMEIIEDSDDEETEEESPETVTTITNNGVSHVFPSLRVAENGDLEKWIFAADFQRRSTIRVIIRIEFQIWRNIGEVATLNLSSLATSVTRSDYPNVYELVVDPPQPVLAGDYVGIRIQELSYLKPLWEIGDEEVAYYTLPLTGGEIDTSNIAGFANPLFAAQIRVSDEDTATSTTSSAINPQPTSSISGISSVHSDTSIQTSIESSEGPRRISSSSQIETSEFNVPLHTTATTSLGQSLSSAIQLPLTTPFITTTPATPVLGTSSRLVMNPSTTTESNERQPTSSPESSDVPTVVGSGSNSRASSTAVVAAIVVIVLLLTAATLALCIFIYCMRRKRRFVQNDAHQLEEIPKSKSFFDNPMYDHLQRKLSKESQGYTSIRDPVYLEVREEQRVNGTLNYGDGDSGYAELEVKITAPPLEHEEQPQLTNSCSSLCPRNSRSPSPVRSSTATPTTPHSYHTLEAGPMAEEYLAPFPQNTNSDSIYSDVLKASTSPVEDMSMSNLDKVPNVYHELEPPTGCYSRLQHNLTGIYVPTQMERRESIEGEDTYVTIEERLYANINERKFFEERPSYWEPACTTEHLYSQLAQNKYREIKRCQIELKHILGSGNFGQVSKGELRCEVEGVVDVAVKTLKSGSSEDEVVRFLQEAAIMGQFRHPNIVQLLGVVTLADEVMIVLEYLSQGDLGTYLVNRRPVSGSLLPPDTPFLLLKFSRDVASGMEHLERKAFVHRDLAARNILVSEDNHCKIGDFGLSRDLLDENYYITKGGMIPWRWTAPEALHYRKYSTATDVWSFGCVMYEIWSLGHTPFEAHSPQEVQVMLEKGERLAPPPGCPRGVYSLMIDCWHPEHASRPTFLHLLKTLASSPTNLLSWAHEDSWGAADAIVLGSPLKTGEKLYPELQHTYTQKSS